MFESAELGHKIDKERYKDEVPPLREALLDAQFELAQQKRFPVIILVGGVDGAGKGETVNLLNEWMDPRHIQVHAMGEASDEEQNRPAMWRFWRELPPKGKIGVFFGSWYTAPILARVDGEMKSAAFTAAIDRIKAFEAMLIDEGALIVKFWFHLSKEAQKKRLKRLERDPATRWRVTDTDWQRFRRYDDFRSVSEHILRETSSAEAPWTIIEGVDERYRNLTAGTLLLQALRKRLANPGVPRSNTPPLQSAIDELDIFDRLDMTQAVSKKRYESELIKLQGRLSLLTRSPKFAKRSLVVVFEGADAAGKGGAIRRITSALDARRYRIVPIAAPSEEERAQPYLWRFWRHAPAKGAIALFDRSWYGRVLVERVEKFCAESDWMRAYSEINGFEEQLVEGRAIVVKFWLTITREEQLRRFKEREQVGFKRFKITEEDWRNREKWDDYQRAICDMVDRTSTELAPWAIVEANDKYFARLKVLRTLCDRIEAAM